MPNFLVIGAAKSGTTALHDYLSQHPDIFMSARKELRFFPFENRRPEFCGPGDQEAFSTVVTTIEEYRAQFAGAERYAARGEASPPYLSVPGSAERIRHHIPDAKLLAVLRQPADRAYSNYLMLRRRGLETLSLADALAAEDQRVAEGWSHTWQYRRRGFYATQLKRYFDLFDREQIHVWLYDDFVENPISFLQDIFRFLNVDDTFVPDMSTRLNESLLPRSRSLQAFLTEPRDAKDLVKAVVPERWARRAGERLRRSNLSKPPFPPEQRRRLTESYREDIKELEHMLDRDLSHWLA
jgi:hypothetical protein